jgi:hypothetical protein
MQSGIFILAPLANKDQEGRSPKLVCRASCFILFLRSGSEFSSSSGIAPLKESSFSEIKIGIETSQKERFNSTPRVILSGMDQSSHQDREIVLFGRHVLRKILDRLVEKGHSPDHCQVKEDQSRHHKGQSVAGTTSHGRMKRPSFPRKMRTDVF